MEKAEFLNMYNYFVDYWNAAEKRGDNPWPEGFQLPATTNKNGGIFIVGNIEYIYSTEYFKEYKSTFSSIRNKMKDEHLIYVRKKV